MTEPLTKSNETKQLLLQSYDDINRDLFDGVEPIGFVLALSQLIENIINEGKSKNRILVFAVGCNTIPLSTITKLKRKINENNIIIDILQCSHSHRPNNVFQEICKGNGHLWCPNKNINEWDIIIKSDLFTNYDPYNRSKKQNPIIID